MKKYKSSSQIAFFELRMRFKYDSKTFEYDQIVLQKRLNTE